MPWRREEPKEESLNQFITAQSHTVYLQSWQWGVFQQSLGRRVMRYIWVRGGLTVAAATVVHQPLPIAVGYGYCPKGPVIAEELMADTSVWQELTRWLREKNQHERFVFIQSEPPTDNQAVTTALRGASWRQAPGIQPTTTQLIDLGRDEKALLEAMHHKTRYNIGLAQRKGVNVKWHGAEALGDFWQLVQQTNQRDGITSFSKEYYEKMLAAFGSNARLVAAYHNNRVLAVNLIIAYGDTVTYAHGASADEGRSMMAPHLLQWETIRWAKAQGHHYYDFRGIAPTDDPQHHWAGITRFKKSFGGMSVRHIGAFDLVQRPFWYRLYRFYRKG